MVASFLPHPCPSHPYAQTMKVILFRMHQWPFVIWPSHLSSLITCHSSPCILGPTPADPHIPWCIAAPFVDSQSEFHGRTLVDTFVSYNRMHNRVCRCVFLGERSLAFIKILEEDLWIPTFKSCVLGVWMCSSLYMSHLSTLVNSSQGFQSNATNFPSWCPFFHVPVSLLINHFPSWDFIACLHTCCPFWPTSSCG